MPNIYDKTFACNGGVPNTQFMEAHFGNHLDSQGAIKVRERDEGK
jgi:hypothetical protein